jgi:hypothetical protein
VLASAVPFTSFSKNSITSIFKKFQICEIGGLTTMPKKLSQIWLEVRGASTKLYDFSYYLAT